MGVVSATGRRHDSLCSLDLKMFRISTEASDTSGGVCANPEP